jgi:hypothetical protein
MISAFFTWVFLMHSKSQTRYFIQYFFHLVETQFHTKIKCLHSDNGFEFDMVNFYMAKGVIHHRTCVETPQQNAIVERKHLPFHFWGDCVLTVVHLINRIPTPLLSNKSPYEILFSKSPSYSHLRVFGCLCFASTLTRNRHKFDPRATPCLFLGYPAGVKGFKLLNLKSKSIFVSRNVIFHESVFPYKSASNYDPLSFNPFVLPIPFSESTESSSPHIVPFFSPQSTDNAQPIDIVSSDVHHLPPDIVSGPIDIPSTDITSVTDIVPSRKSTRAKCRPGFLQDYHCQLATHPSSSSSSNKSGIPYSLSSCLAYHKLSSKHKHFCLSISSHVEPKFFHQAVKSQQWIDAMHTEISALELNNTWIIVDLPSHKQPIGCKWVYKLKYKADGSIERYKARLLPRGTPNAKV